MSALAATAVPTVDEYLVEAITDELTLAKLLGWTNLPSMESALRSRFMFASSHGERGNAARLSSQPMPRWRRDWNGAGELVARFNLNLVIGDTRIAVRVGQHDATAEVADHPTKDDAIRFAMCKAAIAHLTDKQARSMP